MASKPTIPKGTRDFLPAEVSRRNYIFSVISEVFKVYGFSPIETPAMENLSTLLGKYGDEGDKLLFRILNSGDFTTALPNDLVKGYEPGILSGMICEKGLRYDLTVPFARFVVQNRNEITFPFRRYQIQPVWRADRPQKGRYREFFQCDADVIGSDSMLNEAEMLKMADTIFSKLGMEVVIKVNNRKLLSAMASIIGEGSKITEITVAIDKIDKIGKDGVWKELSEKGISAPSLEKLIPIIELSGTNTEKIAVLRNIFKSDPVGIKGLDELESMFSFTEAMEIRSEVELDLSLARGLNYYTGAIIEVKSKDMEIGSICGGGRYDDLTGIFGMPGVSGVGISFGADRIYDVLAQTDGFPADTRTGSKVMFVNFGDSSEIQSIKLVTALRRAGIPAELYPDQAKLKKQFAFADSLKIPYVAILGEEERAEAKITVKEMKEGTQVTIPLTEVLNYFNK